MKCVMKAIGTLALNLLLLISTLSAQSSKKVTIEKTTVRPDGSVNTETIVKTGKEAESFDLESYLDANENDNIVINIENHKGKRQYIRTAPHPSELPDDLYFDPLEIQETMRAAQEEVQQSLKTAHDAMQEAMQESRQAMQEAEIAMQEAMTIKNGAPNLSRGFLGVSPAGDDDVNKMGVAVTVVPGSGAQKAGMKNGDVVLQLDQQPIWKWDDIGLFMINTRPGQQVNIRYRRGDSERTDVAILSDKSNNEPDWGGFDREQWDMNSFQMDERSKDACLGVYSSGEEQGAQVTEFTSASAAEEAGMQIGDVITAVNGTAIKNHDELWNEIAKYKPDEVIRVTYLRDNQSLQADATLKTCDTQNKITIRAQDDGGDEELSRMYIWDWTAANQERLRTSHVITIQRAGEGDTPTEPLIGNAPIPAERRLEVRKFLAFPNPSGGPITISFEAKPVPTIVTIFDTAGRQLFREELNSFSGTYSQQFDLSAYAKGKVIVQVQQADKVFHEPLVLQ